MSPITTHVLDTSTGKPASGVPVVLELKTNTTGWQMIGEAVTDTDGRIKDFGVADDGLNPGHYRLTFETGQYCHMREVECFFPQVTIAFVVNDTELHYHVPLLLSPFGYSTYRGS
jgi:5-hydroxyisourate hydrolase